MSVAAARLASSRWRRAGGLRWSARDGYGVALFEGPAAPVESHRHEELQIVVPMSAAGVRVSIPAAGGQVTRRRVRARQACVIGTGVDHHMTTEPGAAVLLLFVHPRRLVDHEQSITHGFGATDRPVRVESAPPFRIVRRTGGVAAHHLGRLLRRHVDQRGSVPWPLIESVITILLYDLLTARSAAESRVSPTPPLAAKPLARVVAYVDHHLGQRLPMRELAAVAGVSVAHFTRAFRAATGTSPHQYVIERRLAAACRLLDATPLSVGAVAAQTGFSSQSHLTGLFRLHLGMTPAHWRRRRDCRS